MDLRQQHQEPTSIDMLYRVGPNDAPRYHRMRAGPSRRRPPPRTPPSGYSLSYQENLGWGVRRSLQRIGGW